MIITIKIIFILLFLSNALKYFTVQSSLGINQSFCKSFKTFILFKTNLIHQKFLILNLSTKISRIQLNKPNIQKF